MGNCAPIRSHERSTGLPGPQGTFHPELQYLRSARVSIKVRNRSMQVIDREELLFQVSEPTVAVSKSVNTAGRAVWVSGRRYVASIVPGSDPRGLIPKACQDLCFFRNTGQSLFVGLFDGHGKDGKRVVEFCMNFMTRHYEGNSEEAERSPAEFLSTVTVECDKALTQRQSGVEAMYSGTTAVLYLVVSGCVHLACVGDSRVLLGTSRAIDYTAPTPPPRGEDKELLDRVKRRRSISIDKPLYAVQLTKDQKPEDPEETERINSMGGVVRRLMDDLGNNVGPWRVWRKDANYPGLAMSRSIGDVAGSQIGVISTPLVTTHALRAADDFFLVSASDGVWDVMENQEVADFIEAYRYSCVRDISSPCHSDVIKPQNCTIAQLLCEEARIRWLSIVEEEDVIIDDISCVVAELMESSMHLVLPPSRLNVPNLDASDIPERQVPSIPRAETNLRDPRRSSVSD